MVDGECRNRLALPVYGPHPSEGICSRCEHQNGLRGLGDALAWILSWTPLKRLQAKGCSGCKRRQAAMNEALPLKKGRRSCGKCGQDRDNEDYSVLPSEVHAQESMHGPAGDGSPKTAPPRADE